MLFRKMRKEFLPLFRPVMDDEEIKEVTAILKSGWLTTGPKTREFEERFAAYSGAKHGIGVINCTTALFMCLEKLVVCAKLILKKKQPLKKKEEETAVFLHQIQVSL